MFADFNRGDTIVVCDCTAPVCESNIYLSTQLQTITQEPLAGTIPMHR